METHVNIKMPTLIFKAGKFVIKNAAATRIRLSKNAYWKKLDFDIFETTNLREAATYARRFGTESAKRVITRAFQAHYDLPKRLPPVLELDPHQWEGIKWVLARKRSYLAHAPGAGKTAQAIVSACLASGEGQALFIVPPSLTVNWEREMNQVTGWLGIWPAIGVVPRSDNQERMAWRADFIICPDSMLTKPWVYEKLQAMRKKFIAVDEASRFKDPFAKRSLAFYGGQDGSVSYPGIFQDARHVVFLDGSPMPNRPMELWAPTYALHPEAIDCMPLDDFGYRYCGARPNDRGVWEYLYSSNEEELKLKLRRDFMHVVGEERLAHPERRRSLLFMNEDVRSPEYKAWERRNLPSLMAQIGNQGDEANQGEIARMRRDLGLRKIPWVASYAREKLEEKNEALLIFAWHREVCQGLAEKLSKFNPGLIMGGVSSDAREREFDLFQRGKKNCLILNIAAGGRGHNLQRASRVLFAEYSWTDELNRQCEKRASRRGNEQDFVRCEYVVCPGSMDEPVLSSIFTKQRRVGRIIG